jgi:hypothetical protein
MTLVRHSLRRRRTFLIAGGLFLFAFQIFMILVARAIYRTGGFEELGSLMPNFLEQWSSFSSSPSSSAWPPSRPWKSNRSSSIS